MVESGVTLEDVKICYTTYGNLNEDKSNVVWIFHALTANSNPAEWWPELVGEDLTFDPKKHFIVCANMLGSCYGTTGPSDRNFPVITIQDMVKLHQILRDHLGIKKIHLGTGGSMGGQQLLVLGRTGSGRSSDEKLPSDGAHQESQSLHQLPRWGSARLGDVPIVALVAPGDGRRGHSQYLVARRGVQAV